MIFESEYKQLADLRRKALALKDNRIKQFESKDTGLIKDCMREVIEATNQARIAIRRFENEIQNE